MNWYKRIIISARYTREQLENMSREELLALHLEAIEKRREYARRWHTKKKKEREQEKLLQDQREKSQQEKEQQEMELQEQWEKEWNRGGRERWIKERQEDEEKERRAYLAVEKQGDEIFRLYNHGLGSRQIADYLRLDYRAIEVFIRNNRHHIDPNRTNRIYQGRTYLSPILHQRVLELGSQGMNPREISQAMGGVVGWPAVHDILQGNIQPVSEEVASHPETLQRARSMPPRKKYPYSRIEHMYPSDPQ